MRGERLWIPVEVTRVDQSFQEAWKTGLDELAKLPALESRHRVVATAEAWQSYPATQPVFKTTGEALRAAALNKVFSEQYAALKASIDAYIDDAYLDPLKDAPDNDVLRIRLLKVYLALHQADTAIEVGVSNLLDERGDKAATLNHLGNAYHVKGNLGQAALYYKQALALRPEDAGIQRNLGQALQALGRARPVVSREVTASDPRASKAAVLEVDVDSFYWIE